MNTRHLLLGLLGAASLSSASAATIYTESFSGNGSASLNGAAPTFAASIDGGSASATWSAHSGMLNNGLPVNDKDSSAILAFVPVADRIYSLSADFKSGTTTADNDWLGIGFTYNNVVTGAGTVPVDNAGRFTDTQQPGALWAFVRESTTGNGDDVQFFINKTLGSITTTETDLEVDASLVNTLTILLDTTGGNLSTNLLLNGTSITNGFQSVAGLTLAQIQGVGLTHNNTSQTGTLVDNFSLSTIPEPSSCAALVGALALGMVGARRRRL